MKSALAPAAVAPAPVTPPPAGQRKLGILAEISGLPEALAAIAAGSAEAKAELDGLVEAVQTRREDADAWSDLAAALDRAGQRPAAVTVANAAMEAAKQRQDGGAVTRLTRQIAQLELTGPAPSPVKAPAVGKAPRTADAAPAAPAASPEKLEAELENALRDNAAAEALKILQQMAQGSIARGDFAAAQKSYNAALNLAHLSSLGEARADQYANLGRLNLQKGERAEAEAYLRAARDQYEQFDLSAKAAEMSALLRQISPTALSSPSRPVQNGKRTTSIIELR